MINMDIKILNEELAFDLYGFSGTVEDHDYAGTGKRLMDTLWKEVRENGLKHKGINFWVYDSDARMFTGVELKDDDHAALEHKSFALNKYVYLKYVGPYHKLGEAHRGLEKELSDRGLIETGPRVERYGDWVVDESKLVTEIFIGVR